MSTTASAGLEPFGEVVAPRTVRIERQLPGPIERVWSYLTDPEKRKLWFAAGEMEPRAGGKMELVFDHSNLSTEKEAPEKYKKHMGVARPGRVLKYEPPRALAFTWGEGEKASEVEFELSEQGGRVLLVVTHRRLPSRGQVVGVSGGWHAHLSILLDRLEGREPRGFWSNHAVLEAEYERRIPQEASS